MPTVLLPPEIPSTLHVTDVVELPETVAEKLQVEPAVIVVIEGRTETVVPNVTELVAAEITTEPDETETVTPDAPVTVTFADPEAVESPTLVAVMVC